jgi:hypothetical protein
MADHRPPCEVCKLVPAAGECPVPVMRASGRCPVVAPEDAADPVAGALDGDDLTAGRDDDVLATLKSAVAEADPDDKPAAAVRVLEQMTQDGMGAAVRA